jgi:hypothetical protein
MPYGLRGLGGRVYGLGDCTATDPSGCAGPYSSPMANYAYQLNLQNTGQGPPPAPYTPPSQPVNKVCQPWDTACVEGNVTQQVAYQQAVGQAQAVSNLDQCLANGTTPAVCNARWPAGYSGEVPFTNLTPAQQAGAMQTPAQAAAATQTIFNQQAADLLKIGAAAPGGLPVAAPIPQTGSPITSTSGSGVPAGSAAEGSPTFTSTLQTGTSSGFSLSSIPWWGWAAAAGVGFLALNKGGR